MQLTIESLSKTYSNGVRALHEVSLTLNNGMFGLLGPNGAGKSSLMRTIATLQEADSGAITLDVIDVLRAPVLRPCSNYRYRQGKQRVASSIMTGRSAGSDLRRLARPL